MADPAPAQLFDQTATIESLKRQLKQGSGGGTSGGMTDDWKESVNTQLKQLHDDVRRLTGYIIAGTVGPFLVLVAALVALSSSTNARIDKVAETSAALAREVGAIGARFDDANRRHDDTNRRLDGIEAKLDQLAAKSK